MCGNQQHSLDENVEQETVRLMKDVIKRPTEMRYTTESVGWVATYTQGTHRKNDR